MSGSATCEFQDRLTSFLPKMRVWALALTRNASAADDLVQDVAMKTLMASESFEPGTNFSAWVHRIMINHFISSLRKQRESNDLNQVPEVGMRASQEDRTGLRELNIAFQRLPKEQREALHLIGVEERSYEEVSGATGCAIDDMPDSLTSTDGVQASGYSESRDSVADDALNRRETLEFVRAYTTASPIPQCASACST